MCAPPRPAAWGDDRADWQTEEVSCIETLVAACIGLTQTQSNFAAERRTPTGPAREQPAPTRLRRMGYALEPSSEQFRIRGKYAVHFSKKQRLTVRGCEYVVWRRSMRGSPLRHTFRDNVRVQQDHDLPVRVNGLPFHERFQCVRSSATSIA